MKTKELLTIKVKDVMTTNLVTVKKTDVMAVVESLLQKHNINHIPVTDENQNILGILTKNDVQLLKDWGSNLNLRRSIKSNDQILNSQTASDRMFTDLVCVGPEDTLEKCADLFKSNSFHALPVTDGKKLVGIITTYDMLDIAFSK